jgi:hypothetical protein
LVLTWYELEGLLTRFYIDSSVGAIDGDAWSSVAWGTIMITFYAEDRAGNRGSISVLVSKNDTSTSAISGYNLFIIFGVISASLLFIRKYRKYSQRNIR